MPKLPSTDYKLSHAELPPDATPLSLLLILMRKRYNGGDYDGAIDLAKIAAPYLHPRVPSSPPAADLATMPDADLDSLRPQD